MSSGTLAVLIFKGSSNWHPLGPSLPGGDNVNRCAEAGIIPSVPQVHTQAHNIVGSVCV